MANMAPMGVNGRCISEAARLGLDYSGDPCGGIGDQRGIFSTILPGTGIDPDSGSTVFGKTVSRLAELVTIQSR